jgi:hypothetical protein
MFVGLWLLTGVPMWTSLDDGLHPVARVLWALAYAGVLVTGALTIGYLVGRHLTRRRLGARLSPGTVLTSRFTPSTVELRGPLARHELSYDGLVHVERVELQHVRRSRQAAAAMLPRTTQYRQTRDRAELHCAVAMMLQPN